MRAALSLIISLIAASAAAQTFTGKVVDGKEKKALQAVSVILLNEHSSPIAFTQTKADGSFSLSLPEGKQASSLQFSMLGFEKKTISTASYRNGTRITLNEKKTEIREVIVKSKRLRLRSDTLIYSVAGFRQKQDRSIADVIAKMPGLAVKDNGQIEYQGKPISNFYIEGMDLMGGQYAMASENLSADKVKNVQVLRNHQQKKALRNIQFSDQAALNIQLNDDARNAWMGMADIGTGAQLQKGTGTDVLRDVRLLEMMFSKKLQSISMYKNNNTGRDIQHEIRDLTNTMQNPFGNGGWLSAINLSSPGIALERYNINDTHIMATNWLRKTGKDEELRLQANYLFDKTTGHREQQTVYTTIAGNPAIVEQEEASNYRSETKAELQYKVNKDRTFINNELRGYIDLNHSGAMTLLNGQQTRQQVKPRKRFVGDNIEFTRNLGNQRALTMKGSASINDHPGQLMLIDSRWQKLHTTHAHADAQTTFRHLLAGMRISYETGLAYDRHRIRVAIPQASDDNISYTNFTAHVAPSLSFKRRQLGLNASLPVKLIARRLGHSHDMHPVLTPTAALSYQISGTMQSSISYSRQWDAADVHTIVPLPHFTSYISSYCGTGKLEQNTGNSCTARMEYANPSNGLFLNTYALYRQQSRVPLYESTITAENIFHQQPSGLYAGNHTWMLSSRLSKSFALAKFVAGIEGRASWNNYPMLVSGSLLRARLRTSAVAVNMSFRPHRLFSVEEKSEWNQSRQQINNIQVHRSSIQSFSHQLKLFFVPGSWQIQWTNELYHSNDRSLSTNYFSDLALSYRRRTYELGMQLSNIFGTCQYERQVINTTRSVFTISRLRPREFLCKASFNI